MIFLSYASEQRQVAEEIKLALASSGHHIFFDRDSLPVGDEYHLRIRKAVEESEGFVFLISPQSVAQGCYTLTELKYAREKWPEPRGKVLPVMIEKTEYRQIPPYLKAVSVLEPEGNAPAEIAAEIQKWRGGVIREFIWGNVARFIAVLSQPREFIASIQPNTAQSLTDASLFAVFVSVVNLLVMLPAFRLSDVKTDGLTYGLVNTVVTLVFWFLYGSVYHFCAKLVRGRGAYQSSIVAILYLTAFTVISQIFTIPLSLKAIPLGLESLDAPSLSQLRSLAEQLVQSPTGLICSLLLSATALYRWVCTIGVFMIIHNVGRLKGVLIGLLGSVLSWVLFLTVESPVIQLLLRAFSS
jgi:hypothetical protein